MNQLNHLIKDFPKLNIKPIEKTKHLLSKALSFFIPKGPKFFAWFTYTDNKPICIFLNHENNEIQTIRHYYVAFREELSLGTILYGTLIDKRFICEDIYYKNGLEIKDNFLDKIEIIKDTLNDIRHSEYLGSISFFLPKLGNQRLLLEASNLPYPVYGILHIYPNPKIYLVSSSLMNFMFKKREETEDVYELYALSENKEYVFYSTALVNDFKTSHFMKKIVYKKKKNYKNIEFSDSEDDEENVGDFFVGCIFIPEFKKWKPYLTKGKQIDSVRQIQFIEKKIFG